MQVAQDTVVSLQYELLDSQGELIEKTDEPIEYLHGGYDGIFALVEQALQGKASASRATSICSLTTHSASMTIAWCASSRWPSFRPGSRSECVSRAKRKARARRWFIP